MHLIIEVNGIKVEVTLSDEQWKKMSASPEFAQTIQMMAAVAAQVAKSLENAN